MKIYGAIRHFDCSTNQSSLISIELGDTPYLEALYVESSPIVSLDLSGVATLQEFSCKGSQISKLTLPTQSHLQTIKCSGAPLTTLDLTHQPQLEQLVADRCSSLVDIDFSHLTSLTYLSLEANPLTTIDLTQCKALQTINLSFSQLSALQLSVEQTALRSVQLKQNNLSACALDSIYSILTPVDETSSISVDGNPGAQTAHSDIVTNKGWSIDVIGDGTGCSSEIPTDQPTPTTPYVSMLVKPNTLIQLSLKVSEPTEIYIESAPGLFTKETISPTFGSQGSLAYGATQKYRATTDTLKVYGEILGFDCSGNKEKLKRIDVSHMPDLQDLMCQENQISQIDLTDINRIEWLFCGKNELVSLDLSTLNNLAVVDCSENQLTLLRLPNSLELEFISIAKNLLDACTLNEVFSSLPDHPEAVISIEGNPGASGSDPNILSEKGWKCDILGDATGCQPKSQPHITMTTSGSGDWKITLQLSDSMTSDQLWIDWDHDGVRTDDEIGLPKESHPIDSKTITIYGDIEGIFCFENHLIELDLSALPNLKRLSAGDNNLKYIDLSHNELLEDIWIQNNQLSTLDLSHQGKLNSLNCSNNQLSVLTFAEDCPIIQLEATNNKLTTLDLTKTPHLINLDCSNNQLTAFDCSLVTGLSFLKLAGNKITSIDVTEAVELIELNLNDNLLTSIELRNLDWLTKLLLGGNKFTAIDLSGCPELMQLSLAGNPLKEVSLTPCPYIYWLNLSDCGLETIDLTDLHDLRQLYLSYNHLTELTLPDVCRNLVALDIVGNRLRGSQMQALIDQLPSKSSPAHGELYVVAQDSLYGNAISREQVQEVQNKMWQVYQSTATNYQLFDGYTMYTVTLSVGAHGKASIVNYTPYDLVPEGVKLQLEVIPDEGYIVQSITVNGQSLEGLLLEVQKDLEITIHFQKDNRLTTPDSSQIQLYPNPASDYLYIKGTPAHTHIDLYTLSGDRLLSAETDMRGSLVLPLAKLADGSYLLRVGQSVETIIVAH